MDGSCHKEQAGVDYGVDLVGRVGWGTRICQFYETAEDLRLTHVYFLAAGLQNNEACLWILPPIFTPSQAMSLLKSAIPEFDTHIDEGRIKLLSHSEFNSNHALDIWLERLESALAAGRTGLRVAYDASWLLSLNREEHTEHQRAVAEAILDKPMLFLLDYPLAECTGTQVIELMRGHRCGIISNNGKIELMESMPDRDVYDALFASEERYKLFISNLAGIACQWTKDATPVFFHGAVEAITGFTEEELLSGKPTWEQIIHAKDCGGLASREDMFKAADGAPFEREYRIIRKDGRIRWVRELTRKGAEDSTDVAYLHGMILDITEPKMVEEAYKKSQEHFRVLFESSVIGIAIADLQRVLDANEAFLHMVGWTRDDMLVGRLKWREMTPPEYVEADERSLQMLLAHGTAAPYEKRFIRKDGRTVDVLVGAALLELEPISWVFFVLDITQRKQAESELMRSYDREKIIAETLQKSLMPSINNPVSGFGVAGRYCPSLKDAEVGGDFYDLFDLPDGRKGFVIGDVSGKGLQAAVYTAMAKYMLRAYADKNSDPAHVLTELNGAICDYTSDETFITLVYATLNPDTGVVSYANAGHDQPLIYRAATGTVEPMPTTGRAIGIAKGAEYHKRTVTLFPGDFLLLYTDGITDARGRQGFFDIEGLSQVVVANAGCGEESIVQAVYDAACAHADGDLGDDAAVVVLKAAERTERRINPLL